MSSMKSVRLTKTSSAKLDHDSSSPDAMTDRPKEQTTTSLAKSLLCLFCAGEVRLQGR